jgi:hypothetical protein
MRTTREVARILEVTPLECLRHPVRHRAHRPPWGSRPLLGEERSARDEDVGVSQTWPYVVVTEFSAGKRSFAMAFAGPRGRARAPRRAIARTRPDVR